MEEKQESLVSIIILVLGIIMLGAGCTLFFINGQPSSGGSSNSESTNTQDDVDQNIELESTTKDRFDRIIKIGLYSDGSHSYLSQKFANSYSNLTREDKFNMTLIALTKLDFFNMSVDEIPEKYKDDGWENKQISDVSISMFQKEYQNLFYEEYNGDWSEQFNGCPAVYKVDQELGKIFLSNVCDSTGAETYVNKTYKYSSDDNFYYVYQYVGKKTINEAGQTEFRKVSTDEVVDVTSFEENATKFDTLIWRFHKTLEFVSTELVPNSTENNEVK